MVDRFGRDPGIADIIRYYDQPEKCAWHLLSDTEARVLHEELRRCADPDTGFPYASRNYYWITTKAVGGESDILLNFMDPQELIWETIRMLRMTKPHGVRLMIIKARQLYASTLIEAYLAHLTRFNPNNRGLVVSYSEEHAAMLFAIILHIYDQLPWWFRPMIGQRKYEEGLHLINPDPDLRRLNPGLNSVIIVQGANQNVGVAEGRTVNSMHASEFGSWEPAKARKVIIADARWALPDDPSTTAVLETRVQKASAFAERLWEANVELGDDADWYPLFMPIYFDKSHFVPPLAGWKPEKPELEVKKRAADEWCLCSSCGQIRPARFGGSAMEGIPCRDCKRGFYAPYTLQDGQMLWLQQRRKNAEKLGDVAVVEMQQSLATNPQEAFANVTESIFSREAKEWVSATTRSGYLACGYMEEDGTFHAPKVESRPHIASAGEPYGQESSQCWTSSCKIDHRGESERYLTIWQPPMRGVKYAVGVDVGSGHGRGHDYSIIWVNRIGQLPEPDMQVAMYRCNTISAYHLADLANAIGRWYNNALMVVNYSNYQTVGDRLFYFHKYPYIYQWLVPDSLNQRQNRMHWLWNNKNKESAWQVLDGWLRDHSLIAKSPVFAKELRNFQRLSDGGLGAPNAKDKDALGSDFEKIHDDTVTTAMQLVVATHQQDPRHESAPVVSQEDGLRTPGDWAETCTKCDKTIRVQAPNEHSRCTFCGSIWLRWKLENDKPVLGFSYDDMGGTPGPARDRHGPSTEFSFGDAPGRPDW